MKARVLVTAAIAAGLLVPTADPGRATIRFDDRAKDRLVITAPAYRLTLGKRNGVLVELVDRASGGRVVSGSNGCLWGAVPSGRFAYVGGCAYRISYRWNAAAATLTLTYGADAAVTLAARPGYVDLRLTLRNPTGRVLRSVTFPTDLREDTSAVEAGYAPTYLPGVRLGPGFFTRVGSEVNTYPSRWAFADYLALDLGGGHLALHSVNPAPSPLAPVELGFVHTDPPGACSGPSFCVAHAFDTWIAGGETWTSPVVRIRVGETAEQTILDYRHDNGIDAYPSLASKLGPLLPTLARAPLVKADLWKGLHPFSEWEPDLRRLPSPALVHPVAFQRLGHDESYPDFLPPDPTWGSSDDFRAMIETAHSLGQIVMPYLNVSWWNASSPTIQNLPAPLGLGDISVLDEGGQVVTDRYGDHRGYRVSPHVPFVRDRISSLLAQWRTEVPADCLFFDQIGARPWQYDFNPASPTPLAYEDGWLALMAPYADRCLMVEDGWDRLASSFSGFHGGLLLMDREHDEPNLKWGAGNWEPYPLADWLLHDKVLLYQHDLYPGTMTADGDILTWNLAFGLMLSYDWNGLAGTLDSPWLGLVGSFQRALGPHYAGLPLTAYRDVAPGVTESAFGDLTVVANWNRTGGYETDGYGIAPGGFLARTEGGGVLAGAFAGSFAGVSLSAGTHYLLVERGETSVAVRQPIGADSTVAVDPPFSWQPGMPLHATAFDANGQALGEVDGEVQGGRFEFRYVGAVNGGRVASYRIAS